jgi:salicylate hydroxylase
VHKAYKSQEGLRVAVVGAGIGGLTCAIACRRAHPPIDVTVLERAPEILSIGAGIHIPPNSARILNHLGLNKGLFQADGYEMDEFVLRRYKDGKPIVQKPLKSRVMSEYGAEWM